MGDEAWCFTPYPSLNQKGWQICGYSSQAEAGTYYAATSAVKDALVAAGERGADGSLVGCNPSTHALAGSSATVTFTSLSGSQYNHIQCRAGGTIDIYGGPSDAASQSASAVNGRWSYSGPQAYVRCVNHEVSNLLTSEIRERVVAWGAPSAFRTPTLCFKKSLSVSPSRSDYFHRACDGRGPSISIWRFGGGSSGMIGGGYTSASFRSAPSGYATSDDAFLFSITNDVKFPITQANRANYMTSGYGPTFGSGHDFYLSNLNGPGECKTGFAYSCPTGQANDNCGGHAGKCCSLLCGSYNSWTIDELEVWVLPPAPPAPPASPPPPIPGALPSNCLRVGDEAWCFTPYPSLNQKGWQICGYSSQAEAGTYYAATSAVKDALVAAGERGADGSLVGCNPSTHALAGSSATVTFTSLSGSQYNHIQCRAGGTIDIYGGPSDAASQSASAVNGRWSYSGPQAYVRCVNLEKWPRLAQSAATAESDCYDILQQDPGSPSGLYYVLSRRTGGAPKRVYCEMQIAGGGWTVMSYLKKCAYALLMRLTL